MEVKIYECTIPIHYPFIFEIVGNKLVNIEERPIQKGTFWWSKEKGHHKKNELYYMVGIERVYYGDRIICPTVSVSKNDYEDYLYSDDVVGYYSKQYDDNNELNWLIIKKDWIDHWELGMAGRKETLQHGTLLTDLPTMFR